MKRHTLQTVVEMPEFIDEFVPVFLLTMYKKNQKTDLTPKDKVGFRKIVDEIVKNLRGNQYE
jgi:hypothetical protein